MFVDNKKGAEKPIPNGDTNAVDKSVDRKAMEAHTTSREEQTRMALASLWQLLEHGGKWVAVTARKVVQNKVAGRNMCFRSICWKTYLGKSIRFVLFVYSKGVSMVTWTMYRDSRVLPDAHDLLTSFLNISINLFVHRYLEQQVFGLGWEHVPNGI